MTAMHQQGLIEKVDLDRIEVAYNNLIRSQENTRAFLQLGIYALKFQMGYDVNKPLQPSGSIEDIRNEALKSSANKKVDPTQRMEYSLLKTKQQLEKLSLKNQRAGYLPSLALFGNLGVTRGDLDVAKTISNEWFPYGNYGLSLSVPIFSSMGKYYKVQQLKIEMKKTENDLDAFTQAAKFQSINAEIQLKNSLNLVESEKKNVELAREIVRVSKIKMEQGVGTNLELINAETSLKEAETNYFTALYNVAIANVEYQKALGTLYNE
jgi:outer membrane protein TolC